MIIIEGPDGAGKSTLARDLGGPVTHWGPPRTSNPYLEYEQALVSYPTDSTHDRFFYGQFVYGPLFRDTMPSDCEFAQLELLAASRQAIVIWALPPMSVCLKNRRGSTDIYEQKQEAVYVAFDQLRERCRLPSFVYDYTRHDISVARQRIAELHSSYYQHAQHGLPGIGQTSQPENVYVFSPPEGPRHDSRSWLEPPLNHYRPRPPFASKLLPCRDYVTHCRKPNMGPGNSIVALGAELKLLNPKNIICVDRVSRDRVNTALISSEHNPCVTVKSL